MASKRVKRALAVTSAYPGGAHYCAPEQSPLEPKKELATGKADARTGVADECAFPLCPKRELPGYAYCRTHMLYAILAAEGV